MAAPWPSAQQVDSASGQRWWGSLTTPSKSQPTRDPSSTPPAPWVCQHLPCPGTFRSRCQSPGWLFLLLRVTWPTLPTLVSLHSVPSLQPPGVKVGEGLSQGPGVPQPRDPQDQSGGVAMRKWAPVGRSGATPVLTGAAAKLKGAPSSVGQVRRWIPPEIAEGSKIWWLYHGLILKRP